MALHPVHLYNTLSRKVERFTPLKGKTVGLYTCGPTVYNFAHLGNFRTFIFEDLLERMLISNTYTVKRVMNITDVGHLTGDTDAGEDKVEQEARASRKKVQDIIRFYTKAFLRDARRLNIKIPKILAPASKFIPDQIKLIGELVKNGYAYETPTAVYFDVGRFKNYGKLSGQSLEEKITAVRGEVVQDPAKRNWVDFALWFKLTGRFEHHILRWPSPWGVGFPGWHIECSAISRHFLGQPFDMHTGGVDHIGTHHENEIAQSEAAYGKPLARFWLHGEFFLVDATKMAKSAHNFLTLKDVEDKRISPLAFRYLCLTAHYRSPLNFSWVALEHAKNSLVSLIQRLLHVEFLASRKKAKRDVHPDPDVAAARARFTEALRNDLNVPQALAAGHALLANKPAILRAPQEILRAVLSFDDVWGLNLKRHMAAYAHRRMLTNKTLRKLVEERERYRRYQHFVQADRLRKRIGALGYLVEDTPEGPFVYPKNITL